jgi:hypothetical protein
MSKYILIFIYGASTMAYWFLAWQKLGVSDMSLPNVFLLAAIISTFIASYIAIAGTISKNE